MNQPLYPIKAIAFDADDTLWALQTYFEEVEQSYCQLLSDYGDEKEISAALFATESANMEDLGYGCKAFTISLVENAVKASSDEEEYHPARCTGRRQNLCRKKIGLLHDGAKGCGTGHDGAIPSELFV